MLYVYGRIFEMYCAFSWVDIYATAAWSLQIKKQTRIGAHITGTIQKATGPTERHTTDRYRERQRQGAEKNIYKSSDLFFVILLMVFIWALTQPQAVYLYTPSFIQLRYFLMWRCVSVCVDVHVFMPHINFDFSVCSFFDFRFYYQNDENNELDKYFRTK